jgi:hypothetical protein
MLAENRPNFLLLTFLNVFSRPNTLTLKLFQITTPTKVYLEYGYSKAKPFHRETWFVVALAATSIVIIITVVAILCVQSKTHKYKGKTGCHM